MTLNYYRAQSHSQAEPLYDIDRRSGAIIEVFYADAGLARSFGQRSAGWFWWTSQPGRMPAALPAGPFATKYLAYRRAMVGSGPHVAFGLRTHPTS
jgi:hypothetical protein